MSIEQYKAIRSILEHKVRHGQAKKDVVRQLVEDMLQISIPIAARYVFLDVIRILQDNCMPFNPGLEALIRGLSILEKYGKNLLRPERPPLWRVVRLSNSIFKQEVDVIKGARKILAHLGYSKLIEDGLSYLDDRLIPDIPVVTAVTSDILLLRLELTLLAHHEHQQENAFYSYIPAIEIRMVQEKMGVASIPHEQDMESAFALPTPPTYQQVLIGAGKQVDQFQNFSENLVLGGVDRGAIHDIPNIEVKDEELCDLCGQTNAVVKCESCDGKIFCATCNELWHNNPKRRSHKIGLIYLTPGSMSMASPRKDNMSQASHVERLQTPSLSNSLQGIGDANRESEFHMRMNRMAVELMDITDQERKYKRLTECLEEIDKEVNKYKKVIDAIHAKGNEKSHLVQHLTDKLSEIEELKVNFKVICGVDDIEIQTQYPQPSSSTEYSLAPQMPFHTAHQSPPQPSLIDLETPTEPIRNFQSESTSNYIDVAAGTTLENHSGNLLGMLNDVDIQSGMKRNSEEPSSDPPQPATKVYRNEESESPSQTIHVSNQFGHMNIEGRLTSEGMSAIAINEENPYHSASEFSVLNMPKQLDVLPVEPHSQFLSKFSPVELQNKIKKEEFRFQTTQFLDLIRAGDVASFRPEQVEVAVQETGAFTNPNVWLERNWVNQVQDFIAHAKTAGFRISPESAEDVLLEAGNVFQTALELIQTAQNEQIQVISGEYGFEKAKRALAKHKGDKYHALASLQKASVDEVFLEFQNADNNDLASNLKRSLQIDDDIRRKNALTSYLQLGEGIYSETFYVLIRSMPEDLLDTLLEDAIEALTGNGMIHDVQAALHYLDNECMICTEKFPRSKITCLSACGDNECRYCLSCLQQHLTVCVNDKNIRDIVCPVCSKPEFGSDEETKTNFINHVDAILRNMPDSRVHEIFQQKLRDFTLMRLPNFRWCSHCSGGFQFDVIDDNIKMLCPFCHKHTCYKCKKQWEPQHDGISCEQFQKWKEANDPEFQAAGLARHLRENGIDCPECNFRYALAKGGCMHFKCTQCSHEFCSGCSQAFKHGRQCGKLPSCVRKGLHAHHPRDCLFFLRDAEPELLLKLLKDNSIQIDQKSSQRKTCEVMEQKETPSGLKDAPCGRAIEPGFAGLCKLHYMEYLVNLVNTHGLDPANILSIDQLKTCLLREDRVVPDRHPGENDAAFRNRLQFEVKKLPLIHQIQTSA